MRYRPQNSIEDLNVLLAVIRSGNFSSAARELGLPPSSVSRRIRAIEERLGVALFKRNTREVQATEAGIAYADQVERILGDLQDAETGISLQTRLPEGVLHIESMPGLTAALVTPLLTKFAEAYPMIRIDLRVSNGTIETLAPETDVGIRYDLGAPSSLITRKLTTTRQATYAAPSYLAKRGVPKTPDELVEHNLIPTAYDFHDVTWRFRRGDYKRLIVAQGNMRTNDVNAARISTVHGLGITVVHNWMMDAAIASGQIVEILSDYEVSTARFFDRQVHAIYPPAMREVQKVQVFINFLVRELRSDHHRFTADLPSPFRSAETTVEC
ncbi:LysR family transcriptional regulator [Acuticoccus mangrovi]|uniref:LysR family transcriptional regulator n=1 Tax=Acuticoccus mangrovi TaxID=2796142 RepID=A0A934IRR0_9HYPH|nr:LysR family transcriptional regulator [Acuticoccus mangrovi]MBJ3777037.1 LysR family transcriptional regulator [Acuticoccus mangrovi]